MLTVSQSIKVPVLLSTLLGPSLNALEERLVAFEPEESTHSEKLVMTKCSLFVPIGGTWHASKIRKVKEIRGIVLRSESSRIFIDRRSLDIRLKHEVLVYYKYRVYHISITNPIEIDMIPRKWFLQVADEEIPIELDRHYNIELVIQ